MARSDYPEKYQTLIDDETWEFIDRSDSFYPPDTAEKGIREQREIYNALCKSFHAGHPAGISVTDNAIDVLAPARTIPTRQYFPDGVGFGEDDKMPEAIVIYFHGGGFVVGGLDSHDDVCAEICARTQYPVISVDYRLAPESNYPADFEDALTAFGIIREVGQNIRVIVCGDSAGGNLAAAVCHATKNLGKKPDGQVLIYPGLGSNLDQGTFIEHAEAPMITTKDTKFYKAIRTGGNNEFFKEPTCAPLNDTDFSGLPPTVMISAECDPLSGDCGDYQKALESSGVKVHWVNEKGLVHGYLRARHMSSRARDSFTRIVDAVSALGKGEWPYQG